MAGKFVDTIPPEGKPAIRDRLRFARPALGRLADPVFLTAIAAPAIAAALALWFFIPTLAPTVASWDTAEFQTVAPVLGTGHPTGYPSYVILGWLASIVLQPFGEPAYRMNLLQAFLAAAAVAGTVGIVQVLTGRRLIALATGLLLACSQPFWNLATHADYHMFHIALVAILFVALLIWDQRRHSEDPETLARADRWLVAAAFIYGVAVANHSLALLLPPAIGLFVLVADWGVILRWRTVVACVAVLAGTIVVLFAEMPIRAAMNAPLVYGHPNTWSGFLYVALGQQFGGSLQDPLNLNLLPDRFRKVMDLMTSWLGPLALLAAVGLATSLIKRPRYLILSGIAAVVTCGFAAAYANAEINRYYMVPLLIALTWVGLGVADLVGLAGWVASEGRDMLFSRSADQSIKSKPAAEPIDQAPAPAGPVSTPDVRPGERDLGLGDWVVLIGEVAVAAALVFSAVNVVPERQMQQGSSVGAVSEATKTSASAWMHTVLATPDQGGLPPNAIVESYWSASTTLWYGQKVLGLRPDVLIIDDSTRKNDHIGPSGEVWDVFDKYLGSRPVFTMRYEGGCDGLSELRIAYELDATSLSGIYHVVARLEPHVSLSACDPVQR